MEIHTRIGGEKNNNEAAIKESFEGELIEGSIGNPQPRCSR